MARTARRAATTTSTTGRELASDVIPMSGRSRTSRAYTLLELVLVLAIIASTLAMAAPALSGFARGRRAEEAARQFVALTRWARSQAVTDGVAYKLVVDPAAGQWKLNIHDAATDSFTESTGPFGRVFKVPEGVEIQI